MLRTTITNIRQVCFLSFVPRLMRGNTRNIPELDRFEKLYISVQRKVDKSTSAINNEEEYERCQRIIDRAFGPHLPHSDIIDLDKKPKENFMTIVTPQIPTTPEKQCEKCQRLIKEIFGEENAGDRKRDIDSVCIPVTELQATTAKEHEETLAQKVETIEETPLVDAAAKPTIDGFNVQPKILGQRRQKRTARERKTVLNYVTNKSFHSYKRRGSYKKVCSYDELAKRCLDSPSEKIDERLLKEMEKLGIPPSTRRGSKRTAHDGGLVQPDIMRRPRRPVEKTEVDYCTKSNVNAFNRLSTDIPPPFELMPVKANSFNISSCDINDKSLHMERIQLYHLKDPIVFEKRSNKLVIDPNSKGQKRVSYTDEKPPQQLLGHMTAAVMTDESDVMTNKSNQIKRLAKQEKLQPINLKGTIFESDELYKGNSQTVVCENSDEKISLQKLKLMEAQERNTICREKLTSTNLLTELVDHKEISLESQPSEVIREYKGIETLRNLLRTRIEYLTNDKVKRLRPIYEDSSVSDKGITSNVEHILSKETVREIKEQDEQFLQSYSQQKEASKSYNEADDYECNNNNLYKLDATRIDARDRSDKTNETCKFAAGDVYPLRDDSENPVIISEMGSLESIANKDQVVEQKVFTAATREAALQKIEDSNTSSSDNILHPLLDKGAVAHVEQQSFETSVSAKTDMGPRILPNEHTDRPLSLTEMLRKVRERNQMQICKEFEVRMAAAEVEPAIGECGKKNPRCPPPAPTCPPPTPKCPPPEPSCPPPKPCPPTKPPCPNPCKPKCPSPCPPTPCEPKPKCPPPKKSPCDKFQQPKCSCVKIQDALTLLLYLGPQFHIPPKSMLPIIACTLNCHIQNQKMTNTQLAERFLTSLQNLCGLVLVANSRGDMDELQATLVGNDCTDYARTYEPWAPIPSWPIPVKEERKKVVCPKEGCKVIPPRLNAPCKDINPCLNFPKKHFTIADLFNIAFSRKMV